MISPNSTHGFARDFITTIDTGDTTMAFVNEEISEDDKSKLDPSAFKKPFSGDTAVLWKWTVDRDLDAFLLFLRGSGPEDIPEFYAFSWRGRVVRFCARVTAKGDMSVGEDLYWDVFQVELPLELESQRPEILEAIRESIDAHGRFYNRQGVKSVTVNIR